MFAIGARDTTFAGVADDNVEAGIHASATTRTRLLFDRASGPDRAAFFLFRSPALQLIGNVAEGSRFGVPHRRQPHPAQHQGLSRLRGFPPVSGAGIVLFGASGNTLVGNLITGNRPTGETVASGGLVVSTIDGTPPSDNVVTGNTVLANNPDIAWDETGAGNVFRRNRCETSTPPSLC